MNSRPLSITVIAWIIIASSAISLVSTLFLINNPMAQELMAKSLMSIPLQYAMLFVGILVGLVSGVFMLKGANWARLLYVGWSILGFVIGFMTTPGKLMLLPSAIFLAVVVFFLFRPNANAFFSREAKSDVTA
jgi:uncharacterized membrane protein YobD (UPF0266 family)